MEVTVALAAAGTSLLVFAIRCLFVWKLALKALEEGVSLEIGGHNPLAPTVKITKTHGSPNHSGESKCGGTRNIRAIARKNLSSTDTSY
jgi:hypothetical protein